MAIILGNEVALAVGTDVSSPTFALARPGVVTFGRALSSTPCEVAWYNGDFSTDIPETELDLISFVSDPSNLMGRVVTFTENRSGEYYGTVERVYTRRRNNAGTTETFVLIRTPRGQTIEAFYAAVSVVSGQ